VRTDYRKALAEMDKGNWQNARTLLLDLFKRSPTFDVAASLGESEAKLGESAKAAQHFAFALKNVPPKEKAETTTRIRAGLNSVTGNVGTIKLSLNRREAQFLVDGEEVGSFPALTEIYLSPGKHTVQARSAGESETREVEVVAGTSKSLAFVLVPETLPASGLAAPAPTAPAQNEANSTPTPAPNAAADKSNNSTRTVVLITGGSLAVVGLAMGIGFGVAANSAEEDADKYRAALPGAACFAGTSSGDCNALRDAVSRQSRDHTIASVGWALGAVGVVAVGVTLLWPSDDKARKATTARGLSLGWRGDQLMLGGKF